MGAGGTTRRSSSEKTCSGARPADAASIGCRSGWSRHQPIERVAFRPEGPMNQGLLDPIPIGIVFILFIVISLLCFEIGFRVGVWWQAREPGEQEGPTDLLVGSLLGLIAFVLAIT